jgi:lipid A 3-O-deacylase
MKKPWISVLICLGSTPSLAQIDEVRLGLFKNDVRGANCHYHHERGINGNLEVLFPALRESIWDSLYNPKPHVGISINFSGYTSHLYGGLTWLIHWGNIMIEPTFGFGTNTAHCTKKHKKRQRLGSNVTFRESISIGYQFSDSWTGSFMIDHVSHAHIFGPNPGLTTVGFRIGYRF